MSSLRHIFLDLDGVLADFMKAALALHGRPELLENWPAGQWDVAAVLGISQRQFWRTIDSRGSDFWASLDAYPWALELFERLKEIAPVTIASSPSLDAGCLKGKVRWLQRHFGRAFRSYMIGPRKHLLARPDAVLIDDRPQTVEAFRDSGGRAILFPQPWNQNHHITKRLHFVMTELGAA